MPPKPKSCNRRQKSRLDDKNDGCGYCNCPCSRRQMVIVCFELDISLLVEIETSQSQFTLPPRKTWVWAFGCLFFCCSFVLAVSILSGHVYFCHISHRTELFFTRYSVARMVGYLLCVPDDDDAQKMPDSCEPPRCRIHFCYCYCCS